MAHKINSSAILIRAKRAVKLMMSRIEQITVISPSIPEIWGFKVPGDDFVNFEKMSILIGMLYVLWHCVGHVTFIQGESSNI